MAEYLARLTQLSVSGLGIRDITGLEIAKKLKWLNLDFNNISDISLTGLTALEGLDLSPNPLCNVSLTGLTALKHLELSYTEISLQTSL